MARLSPLVREFLEKHPVDCARILEQLDVNSACSLIGAAEPELAAGVLECMMTSNGAECLGILDVPAAASLVKEMKMPQAARLLRAMDMRVSENIIHALSPHVKNGIRASLGYPDQTVGRVMDSNPFSLPQRIPVSEAVKRVKNIRQRIVHEIFVVDDDHMLKGAIRVADLLSAIRTAPIEAVMIRDVPFLYSRATMVSAAQNKGWQTFGTLPVVEKDHTLSGILKSSTLMHVLAEARDTQETGDVFDEMYTMTKMYWIVMLEMMNEVMGKERKQ